jgi:hypothetical protein
MSKAPYRNRVEISYIPEIPEKVPWATIVKVREEDPIWYGGPCLRAYVNSVRITKPVTNPKDLQRQVIDIAVEAVIRLHQKMHEETPKYWAHRFRGGPPDRACFVRPAHIAYSEPDAAYYVTVIPRYGDELPDE